MAASSVKVDLTEREVTMLQEAIQLKQASLLRSFNSAVDQEIKSYYQRKRDELDQVLRKVRV